MSALLFNSSIDALTLDSTTARGEFVSLAIVAPIVEETGKGLFLLVLFLFLRKFFNTPLDGIVYAGFLAAGFAFMENILYFSTAAAEQGVVGFFLTFLARSFVSPFAHVTFTILIGIGLGFGAQYKGRIPGVVGFSLGLAGAIILHSLWNGASTLIINNFGSEAFVIFYCVIEMPIFILLGFLSLFFLHRQRRKTFNILTQYSNAGWFTYNEVYALGTSSGRRNLISVSSRFKLKTIVKRYVRKVNYLTSLRQRINSGNINVNVIQDEAQTLNEVYVIRNYLIGHMPYSL